MAEHEANLCPRPGRVGLVFPGFTVVGADSKGSQSFKIKLNKGHIPKEQKGRRGRIFKERRNENKVSHFHQEKIFRAARCVFL